METIESLFLHHWMNCNVAYSILPPKHNSDKQLHRLCNNIHHINSKQCNGKEPVTKEKHFKWKDTVTANR